MPVETEKSIFFQYHRSGSSWVRQAIIDLLEPKEYTDSAKKVKQKDRQQYDFGLFNRHTPPTGVENKFTFCFIRHPVDWYKSMWSARMSRDRKIDPRFILASSWDTDFEKFVTKSLNLFPDEGFITKSFRYFKNVNFVGRYESLKEDLIVALVCAGEQFDDSKISDIPVNQSKKEIKDNIKISSRMENMILKKEKWIINKFYD